MKKRIFTIFIVLLIFKQISYSITAVFPFKVSLKEDKSLQWLGKAVSLYITCGFKLNGIESFRNEEIDSSLKKYRITFPYNISKALLIHISKEIGADNFLWGEISTSDNSDKLSPGQIIIKTFYIDLKNFRQKYLPVIKGIPGKIFRMEEKLFGSVLEQYPIDKVRAVFPDIKFDRSDYETFVKAMLVDNFEEKIKLLNKIQFDKNHTPDLLNFEFAKSFFFTNSNVKAAEYLDKIKDESYLKGEKFFLSGILDYFDGRMEKSMENFSKVLKTKTFNPEALSNYGMLLGLNHKYEEGIEYLKRSLKIKETSEAYINIVFIHILNKNYSEAKSFLVSALIRFPYSKDLKDIFLKFLSDFPLAEEATRIFSKYIPGLNTGSKDKKIHFKILNPFVPEIKDNTPEYDIGSQYNGANENQNILINETEMKLWRSPFDFKLYADISNLLKKDKKFYSALDYASCALFLDQNKKNYIFVLKLLKRLKKEKEIEIISKKAANIFSQNIEIQTP